MAVAKYGGPIAILKDKDFINIGNDNRNVEFNIIYIYNPFGELK